MQRFTRLSRAENWRTAIQTRWPNHPTLVLSKPNSKLYVNWFIVAVSLWQKIWAPKNVKQAKQWSGPGYSALLALKFRPTSSGIVRFRNPYIKLYKIFLIVILFFKNSPCINFIFLKHLHIYIYIYIYIFFFFLQKSKRDLKLAIKLK